MYNEGDKVTISRGNYRGQEATIIGPAENEEYPVKLAAGGYAVIKASNLKAPQESTIGEGRLAQEIQTALNDLQPIGNGEGVLQALVSRLSGDMPGLGARISWPAESADR
jgi:hypothetical protein